MTAEVAGNCDIPDASVEAVVCAEPHLENLQMQNSELLTSNKQQTHIMALIPRDPGSADHSHMFYPIFHNFRLPPFSVNCTGYMSTLELPIS